MAQHPVLILFAHPALQKSRINKHLIVQVQNLDGVTFHDLYEEYPELDIDVAREQELMEAHEVIVFQHPFYWYSTPAMLKEYQDLVLEHGWAYGSKGTALRGKKMFNAITTGGAEIRYQKEGVHGHTILELLAPIAQTAWLCGMDYLPPFAVHGTHGMTPDQARDHAHDYHDLVIALRDGTLDLEAARGYPRLNSCLDAIIKGSGHAG